MLVKSMDSLTWLGCELHGLRLDDEPNRGPGPPDEDRPRERRHSRLDHRDGLPSQSGVGVSTGVCKALEGKDR